MLIDPSLENLTDTPGRGSSVLVVDDSRDIRNELIRLYKELGFHIAGECTNGVEALTYLNKQEVDLVSLDIVMPEMDGIECCEKIKVLRPQQNILMVSYLAKDPNLRDQLQGMLHTSHVLAKPVDKAQLSKAVADLIASKGRPQISA